METEIGSNAALPAISVPVQEAHICGVAETVKNLSCE
jgi:hypothetical protein